jgi:hypothetical protein
VRGTIPFAPTAFVRALAAAQAARPDGEEHVGDERNGSPAAPDVPGESAARAQQLRQRAEDLKKRDDVPQDVKTLVHELADTASASAAREVVTADRAAVLEAAAAKPKRTRRRLAGPSARFLTHENVENARQAQDEADAKREKRKTARGRGRGRGQGGGRGRGRGRGRANAATSSSAAAIAEEAAAYAEVAATAATEAAAAAKTAAGGVATGGRGASGGEGEQSSSSESESEVDAPHVGMTTRARARAGL